MQNSAARNLILKKRQNRHKNVSPSVIDLTSEPGIKTSNCKKNPAEWVRVDDIILTTVERDILLHPTAWLNDLILAAGQRLLQRQTGARGLQPPCLGEICDFEIQRQDFIQIVSNGYDHWLTISTVGARSGTVNIYDSLYLSVGSHVKDQVAAIVCADEKEITLNHIDVQNQQGTCDCGLFSLAFAACLANGHQPEKQLFDQTKFRKHLYHCLVKGELTMFPTVKSRVPKKVIKSTDTIPIFCECRMPDHGNMVQCCQCMEWYHIECVDVPKRALDYSNEPWFCDNCNKN